MRNLTLSPLTIVRADNTRMHLAAAEVVPKLVEVPAEVIMQGALEIYIPARLVVSFEGIDLSSDDRTPYVVTKAIFEALSPTDLVFVTPDLSTATFNGLGVPHLIRRFIGKPGYQANHRNKT